MALITSMVTGSDVRTYEMTAPHVEIYEVKDKQSTQQLERLFSPPQMYALLTAMSDGDHLIYDYSGPVRNLEGEELKGTEKIYFLMDCFESSRNEVKGAIDVWERYCAISSQVAAFSERPDWIARAKDFDKNTRLFLLSILLRTLDEKTARSRLPVLQAFHAAIEERLREWPPKMTVRKLFIRILFFPFFLSLPKCLKKMNPEVGKVALERIERLIFYCNLAINEKRVFSFLPGEDQTEEPLSLGELGVSLMKDGSVMMGPK